MKPITRHASNDLRRLSSAPPRAYRPLPKADGRPAAVQRRRRALVAAAAARADIVAAKTQRPAAVVAPALTFAERQARRTTVELFDCRTTLALVFSNMERVWLQRRGTR